jgi:MFS family permease
MHVDPLPNTAAKSANGSPNDRLTGYHYFVFLVATLGWLFDTMDQQLFLLARNPAIRDLLNAGPTDPRIDTYSGFVTMIFMMGWAIGGLGFGILGDRLGRAKTMMLTILVYSLFTGLSALSLSVWDFAAYRFLTGLGVGGEFAVGVALVAEVMPERVRPFALGWLQALSAIGNVTAAVISLYLGFLQRQGYFGGSGDLSAWQIMFLVGALPAFLTVLIMRRLKEPERWKAVATEEAVEKQLGSLKELFGTPRWRRNAIVGMLLGFAGVVGLWGIGFFSFELIRSVLRKPLVAEIRSPKTDEEDLAFARVAVQSSENLKQGSARLRPVALLNPDARIIYKTALYLSEKKKPVSAASVRATLDNPEVMAGILKEEDPSGHKPLTALKKLLPSGRKFEKLESEDSRITTIEKRNTEIEGDLTFWAGIGSIVLNVGAFFGIHFYSILAHLTGRRPAFAISFVLALLSTASTFWFLRDFSDVFWMIPLMGFCQLALFGGYAIYFPELFPTRLRSTGTSFCYNVGRFVAAIGPLTMGQLAGVVFSGPDRLRYAGVTMCSFFLIGLFALPFAPETKGKPLPE